jgi:hypothetical protein
MFLSSLCALTRSSVLYCDRKGKGHTGNETITALTQTFVHTLNSVIQQARVGFQADLFEEYICDAESIKFAINLTILIDCLHLFGTSSDTTTAILSYSVSIIRSQAHRTAFSSFYSLMAAFDPAYLLLLYCSLVSFCVSRHRQSADALLKVSLEDAGVVTTCDICSLYSDDFDEVRD